MRTVFALLVVGILILGCTSSSRPEGQGAGGTQNPMPNILQPSGPEEISIGQKITSGDLSYVVTAWGLTPAWGDVNPSEGAQFAWVLVNVTNAGEVPVRYMPDKFAILYRDYYAQPKETRYGGYNLPSDTVYGVLREEDYFPGASEGGYILFEVPEGMGDGEASLIAEIGGKNFSTRLSDPIIYEGQNLVITNYSLSCGYMACHLSFDAANANHVPAFFYARASLKPSLSGAALAYASVTDYKVVLAHMEEKQFNDWEFYFNRIEEFYQNDSSRNGIEIGGPGETAALSFCDFCSPESVEVQLPPAPGG